MDGKEFSLCISVNDSLKELVENLKMNNLLPVFILCQYSIVNYPNINIRNFINKTYSEGEKSLIQTSPFKLSFTLKDIISIHLNKKEIFIGNAKFMIKLGISPSILKKTNIYYYTDGINQILYFLKEAGILLIKKNNNLTISNQIINNNNENNKKKYILYSLILLYANEKELNNIFHSKTTDKFDLTNYTLVNKSWIDNFKDTFYYNDLYKFPFLNEFTTYKEYFDNLLYLISKNELKNIESKLSDIPEILAKQMKLIPAQQLHEYYQNIKWPTNFEIIHESLFNILKKFSFDFNDLQNYQLGYKIIYSKSTLYLQSKNEPNIIYVYICNNKSYILLAFVKFQSDLVFQGILNKHLKVKPFVQYLIEKKIDMNELNKRKNILNSNNAIIADLTIMHQINQTNIKKKENIQVNPMDQGNLNINEFQSNPIFQNNISNPNDINLNIKGKQKDIVDILGPNYLIYKRYHKFYENLKSLKKKDSFYISSANQINEYLSMNTSSYLPVYLMEEKVFNYCVNILNFNYYLNYEKETDQRKKEEILKKINKKHAPDFSNWNKKVIILPPNHMFVSNIKYSMIDENFYNDIKLPKEKYKSFKALLILDYSLLYFKEDKILLKIENFNIQNNRFNLSEIILNDQSIKTSIPPNDDSIPPIPIDDRVHTLGLENIGATCYMNATLQCLCHITSLKNYFQSPSQVNRDINNKQAPMAKSFSELLNKLWSKSFEKYYAPHNFKNLISNMNPLFRGIQANDSKDLIIFIYETLHNELNNPTSNNDILNNINNQNFPEELKLFRQNYFSQNNSIMTKIFYSEQSSNLTCCSCNINKISFNIINFLIFPLEKIRLYLEKKKPQGFENVSLEDCFEQFEEKELLSGPNQIYCNTCHRQSNAISYNKLYNCPEVLTIILNRGKGLEFNVEFQFPLDLNINKYVIDKNCDTNYELIGVLTHLGPSGMSGHFIAYCKSPINGQWYCYNDAEVTQCQNVMYEINSNGIPYVLYYQRKSILTIIEGKKEEISLDNYSDNYAKKKDILDFNYEGKEQCLDLNIEENKLFYDIFNEVKNKFDNKPEEPYNCYIMRNNNKIPIDPYKGVKDNGLKNNDKIYIGNNYKNTINDNPFVLIFTYEGKEINVNIKIEEYKLLFEIICDLKNKNEIPQEANNFFLMKDNDMVRIDTSKGVQENGLKNGDKICVIV